MAKKTARPAKASDIGSLLRQRDRIDRELLKVLALRARVAQRLARARTADGKPPWDPEDEVKSIEAMLATGASPLEPRAVNAIVREVASGCRALARRMRVAYLGPEFSFSHLAARHQFGSSVDLIPVGTISAVFEEVHRKQADFGLVPLENSTDGRIADTLDMFARLPLPICGEVSMRIHHHLLGRCPRDRVTEVFSKPQALSQCRGWLAKHLPGARTVEMTSTARAAQIAAEKEGAAAIASRDAGTQLGLDVLAAEIEDNPNNVTRFALIGDAPPRRTGHDKTSIMFQIAHQPGSLADVMVVFKRTRLNLTWIESFPLAGSPNEYTFFAELDGYASDARVRRAIDSLRRKTLRLEVLGSYPRAEIAE
ncbi:MAG: prephenate dehydratase [Planctomycetes bacterium]|nr:prephenate dehydratase [Planctomycetota bacterium]